MSETVVAQSHQDKNYKTKFTINNDLISNCVYIESLNYDTRPEQSEINLLVIHCASLPEGEFGNDNLEKLFSGRISAEKLAQLALPEDLRVSTHLFINRRGMVTQFVPFDKRAWHAGLSIYNGEPDCNNFSIGIELEGTVKTLYTEEQYATLEQVTKAILNQYKNISKHRIVGHSDIAPERKTDPGKLFDWHRYLGSL